MSLPEPQYIKDFPGKKLTPFGHRGSDGVRLIVLAGVVGFEPTEYRNQNPGPYHLAIPQYTDAEIFISVVWLG